MKSGVLGIIALSLSLTACHVGPLNVTWGNKPSLKEQHACAVQAAWAAKHLFGPKETTELMGAHYELGSQRCLAHVMWQGDNNNAGERVLDANSGKVFASVLYMGNAPAMYYIAGEGSGNYATFNRAVKKLMAE